MLQTFYWDCPRAENREHEWWPYIKSRLPQIIEAGFTALWLPPANKAADWKSMGYDPYDYYDLGEFDQKGGVPTWFGFKSDLVDLIKTARDNGLHVYADLVFNHNSGADEREPNPMDGQLRWTKFTPRSGKFFRDWKCFNPSRYQSWDGGTFGEMPDLCHRAPTVYTELVSYARWLMEEIGFDGFRYDMVKGYGGWMVRSIQELRALRGDVSFKPYGVGECWDSERTIDDWLDAVNNWSDNPVDAFDFPLRWRLRELCDGYGFSLRTLAQGGVLMWDRPDEAATFVENHDVVRDTPIINDKILAYAYILTHQGYPCVFWQDYFNWNLAQPHNHSGINALVRVHEQNAAGPTQVLFVDDDLYIMQRPGFESQSGLIFVLNNRSTWNGTSVQTRWQNRQFLPAAWHGRDDTGVPGEKWTNESGWAEFWAPPRGYVVYLPV
jgi:alpha-amylase